MTFSIIAFLLALESRVRLRARIHPTCFIFCTKQSRGPISQRCTLRCTRCAYIKASRLSFGACPPREKHVFNGRLTYITSLNKFRDEDEEGKKKTIPIPPSHRVRLAPATLSLYAREIVFEHLLQWKEYR